MATTELAAERQEIQRERAEIAERRAEAVQELRLMDIFRSVRHDGKILPDNVANRNAVLELANPGEENQISGAWLNKLLAETPSLATRFIWAFPPASKTDPRQLEKDRKILEAAARANGNFGASDANLSLCRDILGAGFAEYHVIQAFRSGQLRLAPPSDDEREQWEAERLDQEKLRLLNASTPVLKQDVRAGYADRRAQAAQAEADRVLEQKKKFQHGQFKPLPREWNGQRFDAAFIRAASPQQIRKWRELFGSLQLDLRLRGEN
jgi:hypothetical protein